MKIVISESQYKRLIETSNPKNINEGELTTLLIGGIAALGLLGIKSFLKVFLNVFIDSAINGFFGYIDDIKNIVAPEPYIKFLKRLEKSEKFNSEFLKFVEESQTDGRLDGYPFWIENVTELPSFIELFDEFTEKENIGEFEKNQLLILIRKSMIKSYARNGRKIVEALKKKMSNNQNEGLNESEEITSKFDNKLKDKLWSMGVEKGQKLLGGYKNYIGVMFDGDVEKYFEETGQQKYYIPNNGMEMYINELFIDVLGLKPIGWKGGRYLGDFTWTSDGINYRVEVFVTPPVKTYIAPEVLKDQKMWRVIGRSGDSGWGFPFISNKNTIGKRGRQQIFKQIINKFGL